MFREMKRKERQLSAELTEKILNKCTSGVLSVIGDDGYPYGVPVSYAYSDGKIFFHCAKEGHKVDAIKNNPKVSFTVIAQDDVVPEAYGTDFASVIAFGKASFVEDPEENRSIFRQLKQLSVDIGAKNIDNVDMSVLSMGMTGDYQVAIEEGATHVRVGTGIFGERNYDIK